MSLLTISNVIHAYGTQRVLDGATVAIEQGEKVGMVGRNGSGKTTLMNIIRGSLSPDTGSMQLQKGMRVGYLSQDPKFDTQDTVRDAAERAFDELFRLHKQLHDVFDQMASADGDVIDRLLRRQADLEAKIEVAGGYTVDHRIDATLHGLGFTDDQFTLSTQVLSGGQRARLALARLLLEAPDLLLLDEPTNHLDIVGRKWLEEFLADEYTGAVLVVSHDRWLLDRVVSRIIEIERGQVREYPGNYHKYLELRLERQLTAARVHDKQLSHIRREKEFIMRYKTGQRAKQARGRQSRLDRFKQDNLVERPIELATMKLKLAKAPRSGDQVITAEGISKRYDDKVLFENIDLSITRGERIGVIGPNGVGKTTLVKCLLDEIETDSGNIRHGSRLEIGTYNQLHENIDLSLTVWQYLQGVIVSLDGQTKASEQQARDLAGAFLFSGDEQDKVLSDLSGGERGRAVLAGLVAGARNVLVLDEPTNHLDIPSAERLEHVLSTEGGYEGTLVLITHDRALLDATCDRLIIFDGAGNVTEFLGNYSELLEHQTKKQQEKLKAQQEATAAARKDNARRQQKQSQNNKPKKTGIAALSISKLESNIESLQEKLIDIDGQLLVPEVYTDGERCKDLKVQRETIQAELEPLEAEWARRAEME